MEPTVHSGQVGQPRPLPVRRTIPPVTMMTISPTRLASRMGRTQVVRATGSSTPSGYAVSSSGRPARCDVRRCAVGSPRPRERSVVVASRPSKQPLAFFRWTVGLTERVAQRRPLGQGQSDQRKNRAASAVATTAQSSRIPSAPSASWPNARPRADRRRVPRTAASRRGGHPGRQLGPRYDDAAEDEHEHPQQVRQRQDALGAHGAGEQQGKGDEGPGAREHDRHGIQQADRHRAASPGPGRRRRRRRPGPPRPRGWRPPCRRAGRSRPRGVVPSRRSTAYRRSKPVAMACEVNAAEMTHSPSTPGTARSMRRPCPSEGTVL